MKKHLLKTMLVATGLLTSAVSAWADGTITATLVHTAGTAYGAAAGTANTVDASAEYFNNDNTGSRAWDGWAFAEFSYEIPDGEKIKSATLTWKIKNAKPYASSLYYLNAGTTIDYNAILAETKATFQYNGSRTFIETTTNNPKGDISYTTDVTDAITKTSSQKFTIFQFTGNNGSATLYGKASDFAPTLTITTASASAMTTYDVKYTDEQGNEIKTSKSYDVTIGDDATAGSEDMASFFINDKKYIYKSGNTTIKANEDATQNVITLVFRQAETWDYTVNASVNGKTKEIVSGFDFEGESVAYNYPQYFNVDGVLYEASRGKSGYYLDNATLDADNKIITVNYSATNKKNVVYYSEAEEIEGLTPTNGSLANIRCSNGLGAYNANEAAIKIVNLPAGNYNVTATVWGTRDNNILLNYGESENLAFATTGSIASYTLPMTLKSRTDITIPQCGTKNAMLDYLYIQKLSEIATISSAEYATYVTTSAVKVPENVKVLTVKANTTGIETAELAAGTVIPAGTAVVLNAEAGDYTLELADEAGTTPANNDLTPATADITADGTQYCLTQNKEGKVGFAKVKAGVNIPAGKAYLVVSDAAAANFFALDGSTTAIKNVEAAQTADNTYYTLQGVKVERPAKGIYIKNGKKVVIK